MTTKTKQATDRTVHAEHEDGRRIVHYAHHGTWHVLTTGAVHHELPVKAAAKLATEDGWTVRLEVAGGGRFDRIVKAIRAGARKR